MPVRRRLPSLCAVPARASPDGTWHQPPSRIAGHCGCRRRGGREAVELGATVVLRHAPRRFLQGTLDMLVLRTLLLGPAHGHAIAHAIERNSDDVLQVEQGSLYPALHRLLKRGWIEAEEGVSENNRRAKFYRLTAKGKDQLAVENTRSE